MTALVAGLLALGVGPLIYAWAQQRSALARAMDGFVFVAIGGLVLIEVLPEVARVTGWWTAAFVALGLWGPSLLERAFARIAHRTHMLTVLLSGAGLVAHTVFDGTVLTERGDGVLAMAVVLHRVPVSLAVWWLVRPVWGRGTASLMLVVMAAGTVAGYVLGGAAFEGAAEFSFGAVQALVAGSVLHVVFNRPHLDPRLEEHRPRGDRAEGLGNLAGLALFVLVLAGQMLAGDAAWSGFTRLLELSLAAAPALLLGYAAGGLLAAFMPMSSIQWLGRGGRLTQATKGMLVGLPLPVCSCGVVPLYRSFVERGAPPAAAMAFLIATPELGLDAILISIPLLGLDMTLARIVAAALVALCVGWLLARVKVLAAEHEDCTHTHLPEMSGSVSQRLGQGLRYGFGDLVDSTAPWIVLGLVVAVFAQPLLEHSGLQQISPAIQVVAFALIGLPIYVCATGSTPIVAAMLAAGIAPGAALAFLLTGPATNPATFGVLSRLHGARAATGFGLATAGLAILGGWVVNSIDIDTTAARDLHGAFPGWLAWLSLSLMLAVFLASLTRMGARRFVAELRLGRASAH